MAEAKKERKKHTGPRNVKPTYLVYKGDGVDILAVTKDAFEILRLSQGSGDVKFVDVSNFMKKKTKLAVAA